jgi:ABC-type antimicrobial peptide transport system permease subunit
MKNIKEFIKTEFLAAWKYYVIYLLISSVLFAVTVSMFSVAVSVPEQYENTLRAAFPRGVGILVNFRLEEIETVKNCGADYVRTSAPSDFSSGGFSYGGRTVTDLNGEVHIFRDYINKRSYLSDIKNPFVAGKGWTSADNTEENKIWISKRMADELNVKPGGSIRVTGRLVEFKVIGVFADAPDEGEQSEYGRLDYVISYSVALKYIKELELDIQGVVYLEVFDILDIAAVANNLNKAEIQYLDFSGGVELVRSLNLSRTAFWALTGVFFIIGAFAVFNLIFMQADMREKTYGLYKVLGCASSDIVAVGFVLLACLVVLAAALGTLGAFFINGYFREITYRIFEYKFDIPVVPYAPFAVLAMYVSAFSFYYYKLKRKSLAVSPLVILAEEK